VKQSLPYSSLILLKSLALLLLLTLWLPSCKAQPFPQTEDSLRKIASHILAAEDDFIRLNNSQLFLSVLTETLQKENSFDYPFDSLKTVARQYAPDRTFRIFTWAVPKKDGSYEFSGIIQMQPGKKEKGKLWKLTDKSEEMQLPENQILDCNKWYGALYYSIIKKEDHGKVYYTLLGWDGNNSFSRKKLIEILTFKASGQPVFGSAIFSKFQRTRVKRVIFEYSAQASMSLDYSTQFLNIREKKKNNKKATIKKVPAEMIVFDRLSPMDPQLEGQFQFYVPETNSWDAFIFEGGKWVFYKDVDARNPDRKSKAKKNQPDRNIFPSK
jgi:hypothetical protein